MSIIYGLQTDPCIIENGNEQSWRGLPNRKSFHMVTPRVAAVFPLSELIPVSAYVKRNRNDLLRCCWHPREGLQVLTGWGMECSAVKNLHIFVHLASQPQASKCNPYLVNCHSCNYWQILSWAPPPHEPNTDSQSLTHCLSRLSCHATQMTVHSGGNGLDDPVAMQMSMILWCLQCVRGCRRERDT